MSGSAAVGAQTLNRKCSTSATFSVLLRKKVASDALSDRELKPIRSSARGAVVTQSHPADTTSAEEKMRKTIFTISRPPSREIHGHQHKINDLDADERHYQATQPVNGQIATQHRRRAGGSVFDTLQSQRNQHDDDQRIENHR